MFQHLLIAVMTGIFVMYRSTFAQEGDITGVRGVDGVNSTNSTNAVDGVDSVDGVDGVEGVSSVGDSSAEEPEECNCGINSTAYMATKLFCGQEVPGCNKNIVCLYLLALVILSFLFLIVF
jgi:hypothetical protein